MHLTQYRMHVHQHLHKIHGLAMVKMPVENVLIPHLRECQMGRGRRSRRPGGNVARDEVVRVR